MTDASSTPALWGKLSSLSAAVAEETSGAWKECSFSKWPMRVSQRAFSFTKGSCLLLLVSLKKKKAKKKKHQWKFIEHRLFLNSFQPMKICHFLQGLPHAFQLQLLQELVIKGNVLMTFNSRRAYK